MESIDSLVKTFTVINNLESNSSKIEIFSIRGKIYVRKTIKSKMARALCSYEVIVLTRLKGMNGVQQIVEQDSEVSFISEYIPGVALGYAKRIPPDYFNKLRRLLSQIHERGIADLDFAHSVDLLIDNNGNPAVIDLAASIIYDKEKPFSFLVKPVFEYACDLNRRYLLKRQLRYSPDTLTEEEIFIAKGDDTLTQSYKFIKRLFN